MGGTILNVITVAVGSAMGLLVGNRLPGRVQESVVTGLGLVTLFVGIDNAGATGNIIIPLLSISIGAILGEMMGIDARLENLAGWLQQRFAESSADQIDDAEAENEAGQPLGARERFITGFVTASLVFCVGPLTFLGAIQDGMGLRMGFEQLAIKSVLDGFAAMAFAASFGIGVAFSILTVFFLQGGLALAGFLFGTFMTEAMVAEMTSTGGLILVGLALVLLEVKKPRMANFLPGLLVAPLLVLGASALGIEIYPL